MKNLTIFSPLFSLVCTFGTLTYPTAVAAQDEEGASSSRTRIALGPQIAPSYPGSDEVSFRPLIDFSRARDGEEFSFEAPDESAGFSVYETGDFSFGPSIGVEGKRSSRDVGGVLPKVGFTFEVGGFAQFQASDNIRIRADTRYGLGGHKGIIGVIGADYVMREGDEQLLSFGPRVTLTDQKYQNAYFGIRPVDAGPSGLPAYKADGGVQAVGATIGYIRQFTPNWGIYSYAKYDRLVGDAANSPLVREFGSRNQFSGGVALSYTFGNGVK